MLHEDPDEDLVANMNRFTQDCILLHVVSLIKIYVGSMSRIPSVSKKDVCSLFTNKPFIIDLGLTLEGYISVTGSQCCRVTPNCFSIIWCIVVEAMENLFEIKTRLRKY